MTQEEAEKLRADFWDSLETEFEASEGFRPNKADWLDGRWSGITLAEEGPRRGRTGVNIDTLKRIGAEADRSAEGLHAAQDDRAAPDNRRKMIEDGRGIDWAMAEALAFGTLLEEGFRSACPARMSNAAPSRSAIPCSPIR